MINTFSAMAIDIYKKSPRLANVTGGLSGPAIKPIALHMISRVYRTIAKSAGVPIIGMGGIQFWTDAVEFLLAGASAVGVGTALFVDPAAPTKILQGIVDYMQKTGISHLQEIIGALQLPGDQPRSAPYP
jgi:dihydroorotate dehydrogenase (NAD+) catalytic subunit